MSESLIRVESVTKRYGDITAVDEVSLDIRAGEVCGLVGANGAGKSTLIRMIVGITEPDAGKVFINGEELKSQMPTARRHLGYLPEELILYEQLTGSEYLRLVAGLKEIGTAAIPEELDFFELGWAKDKLVGGYSLGMRKKLGLAAAFSGSPDVIVLDEPLNGLDVEMMRKLRLRIESVSGEGRAVLVSSHVMSFVERVAARVAVMRAGHLVADESPVRLRSMTGLADEPFEDVFFHLASKPIDAKKEIKI